MSFIYPTLIIALAICSAKAFNSPKTIGKKVAYLTASLMPPVLGNMLIILTQSEKVARIGYYTFFIGMNLVMYSMIFFTIEYCNLPPAKGRKRLLATLALIADTISLLLNPIFKHAFTTKSIMVEERIYHSLVPLFGQTIHRFVDYTILFVIILLFVSKTRKSANIYAEKYRVILYSMLVCTAWQTFYILTGSPIDRSMIGFSLFGIAVYYFALIYRPTKLMDKMLADIATGIAECVFFFDPEGKCIWVNENGEKLIGLKEKGYETTKETINSIFPDLTLEANDWCQKAVLDRNGKRFYYKTEKRSVYDDAGKFAGSFLLMKNITAEQTAIEKEIYEARHDTLTDLYTRECVFKKIADATSKMTTPYGQILYIDVDNFKMINDIYGREFGDQVLIYIAQWLKQKAKKGTIYGRIGSDVFGVFIPRNSFDKENIERDLRNFVIDRNGVSYKVQLHVGIYEIEELGQDVSSMFDKAHMALSTIKDQYNVYFAVYNKEMRKEALWAQRITADLPDAIYAGEIIPYLQPIVDTNQNIVGAEALVRWNHPEFGMLPPISFIPTFEKNGMISMIDHFIWERACQLLRSWKKTYPDIFLSINISTRDFYFMDIYKEITELTDRYEIDKKQLRLEITESALMTDVENKMKIINKLRKKGFLIEMDDFGSGYSSLNLLKDMNIDIIKIDMGFLAKTTKIEKSQKIVHNIINMSKDLGIGSLTEGVETENAYQVLTEMGCDLFQGYYFAKPMPVEEFIRHLQRKGGK